MDCRSNERRSDGSLNDKVRCWKCNHLGHIVANYHTMRCYSCSGFGHKAQECPSQRSQPRRIPSYTSAIRTNESWKKYNEGNIEDQKTNNISQWHSKVWVRKNILLDLNEVDNKCKNEDGCHMASQIWGLPKALMHLKFMEFGGWTHRQLVGPRIVVTSSMVIGGAKTISCDLMNSL